LFQQSRPHDLHPFSSILVLRFFVLAGHNNPRRNVGYAHGRVRGVDALPSRSRRAKDIDPYILRINVDFYLIGFGQHSHRYRGGVNPARTFGNRNPLHAMNAASNLRRLYAPFPSIIMMISLKPPKPVGFELKISTRQPRDSAYRLYMRYSSPAKRAASSPPVPALISIMTFLASLGSLGKIRNLRRFSKSSLRWRRTPASSLANSLIASSFSSSS